MLLKRFLIIILVVSGFGSMQAIDMIDPISKELLERALVDQGAFEDFRDHYRNDMYNVDKLLIEPDKTAGQLIADHLVTHAKTALKVAELVHSKRTNRVSVIRTLYRAYENGQTVWDDLVYWVKFARPDVDKVHYDPVNGDMTIGQHITKRLKDRRTRKEALAVAELLQGTRTNKNTVFRVLYKAYEIDREVLNDLESWFQKFPLDVDRCYYAPAKQGDKTTIGEHILERLRDKATRKEALEVACIVDLERSRHQSVIQTLYRAYEVDPTALEDLENWFDCFEEGGDDIDYVDYDSTKPGKTIGDRIAERLNIKAHSKNAHKKGRLASAFESLYHVVFDAFATKKELFVVDTDPATGELLYDGLSAHEHRKEALAFAKLAQRGRSKKHSVTLTLFKAYEQDPTVFADLKEWQDFVKADSSKIYYDSDKKITLAQRIEALKRDDVSNLFKLSPATPSDITIDKEPIKKDRKKNNDGKWSLGKKVGAVGALVAGAGLVYYFMNAKDSKNTLSQNPQTLPAAA